MNRGIDLTKSPHLNGIESHVEYNRTWTTVLKAIVDGRYFCPCISQELSNSMYSVAILGSLGYSIPVLSNFSVAAFPPYGSSPRLWKLPG